jgi:hypothetical protein
MAMSVSIAERHLLVALDSAVIEGAITRHQLTTSA